MGAAFTISALVNWSRRYQKNKKVIIQLVPLFLSLALNIFMCSIGNDALNGTLGKHTTVLAFLTSNVSDTMQYYLTYFMALRLLSLMPHKRQWQTNSVKAFSGVIVACYFVDHIMTYAAIATTDINSLGSFTSSYYFNGVGKTSATIGLFFYLTMVSTVDVWLLLKIRNSQRALSRETSLEASHTQSFIILLSFGTKIAECVFKLLSVLTTYTALDSYLRALNCSVEIWSITELGITVEEIMYSKNASLESPQSQMTKGSTLKRPAAGASQSVGLDDA
ncbi:hypothetical protein SpCBS45565_g00847 [Spizellomyces sp. 'palustris']|nr:hypothetical protein SpCBS45565_g00847 [Spizellomyces sp. 'palustris']